MLSAYALSFGGLLLLGGRAADLLGRLRVFMVGVLVFFTAASLVVRARLGLVAGTITARVHSRAPVRPS